MLELSKKFGKGCNDKRQDQSERDDIDTARKKVLKVKRGTGGRFIAVHISPPLFGFFG